MIQVYAGWDGFGFAPDWVHKKYPEAFVQAEINDVNAPPSSSYYSDHKAIQDAVLRFMKETARVAVQYPNFYGWDLWSEPRALRLVGPGTRARYQQWLAKKYGSIEALNLEWYETYASFDDVEPQRTGGIGTYAMDLDWRDFIAQKGAEDMATQYAAIRSVDKTHVITSHASPPSVFGSQLDDFQQAEALDYYGLSVYPRYVGEPNLWRKLMGSDFSRSANKKNGGFYVGEFQAGFSTNGLRIGDPVTPDDHRTWIWSLIAKGARSINVYAYYVMSSGSESGGFGLIGLDGKVTERATELGKTARLIEENKALLIKSKPVEAQVAIVYNPSVQRVGGARGTPANTPLVGGVAGQAGNYYVASLTGYYRPFAEHNVPVDFIHVRDLATGNLSQYRLIVFPCPIILSPEAAAGLKRFVEQGGSLMAEARLAWNSEHAYSADVIPGMGLSEVFGIRETKIVTRESVKVTIDEAAHPALAKLKKGDVLTGAQFAESVEPLPTGKAKVLARLEDGTAAITSSSYGKGQTLFVGTFLGLANQSSNQGMGQFLMGLVDWARVERPFTTSFDGIEPENPLEARMQENADGLLLFLINHGKEARSVTVNVRAATDADFSLNELLGGRTQQLRATAKMLTLTRDMPPKQVEVWEITRAGAATRH
jgi:beta-galactosidase